jgi:hypothetical protein
MDPAEHVVAAIEKWTEQFIRDRTAAAPSPELAEAKADLVNALRDGLLDHTHLCGGAAMTSDGRPVDG